MTEQEKREKVIEGLNDLRSHFQAMAGISSSRQGRANHIESARTIEDAIALLKAQEPETLDAPKPDNNVGCWYDITHNYTLEQVVSALKSQEPRVMTLAEVNALDWDYCYLEQERLPGKEYRGMLGKYIMTCVTWPSITAAKISYSAENYGRTWRCWTSRPTDEQREAVKWE